MTSSTIGSTGRCMLTAILALGFSIIAAAPVLTTAAEPPPEWDGLLRVPDKGADHLYVLRGADFSKYKSVRIEPVTVAFDEKAQGNANVRKSVTRRLSSDDMEKIRMTLAQEFHTAFENELTKGGYALTTANGDNVLTVTPQIVNLYVSGPTGQTSGRGRLYVASTGRMTLVLELRDSVTGQLLARVVDTAQGRGGSFAVPTTSLTTMTDARNALNKWAGYLLTALNYAKESSAGTAVAEKKTSGVAE